MAGGKRTTIVLGAGERRAAKTLAARWGVTPSEAIRRAVLKAEAEETEDAAERRRRARIANLDALFAAFSPSKSKLKQELKRLSEERDAW
jgi:hypothetical protein